MTNLSKRTSGLFSTLYLFSKSLFWITLKLEFSRPGNASIESFNGRLRQECLNQNWFLSLTEAMGATMLLRLMSFPVWVMLQLLRSLDKQFFRQQQLTSNEIVVSFCRYSGNRYTCSLRRDRPVTSSDLLPPSGAGVGVRIHSSDQGCKSVLSNELFRISSAVQHSS